MPIERRHVFICKAQGDNPDALAGELMFLAQRLKRGDLSYGVVGGPSSGCTYSYRHDPNQTHETYFEQIEAELDADRAKVTA